MESPAAAAWSLGRCIRYASGREYAATGWQAQENATACASIGKLFTTWRFLMRLTGRKGDCVSRGTTHNGRTPFPPYFSHNTAKLTSQKAAFRGWYQRRRPRHHWVVKLYPFSQPSIDRSIEQITMYSRRACIQMHHRRGCLPAIYRSFATGYYSFKDMHESTISWLPWNLFCPINIKWT